METKRIIWIDYAKTNGNASKRVVELIKKIITD
jgi:hypothetical protein